MQGLPPERKHPVDTVSITRIPVPYNSKQRNSANCTHTKKNPPGGGFSDGSDRYSIDEPPVTIHAASEATSSAPV